MVSYKDAGVDVEAGYKVVKLISESVKNTFRKEVLSNIGGFGGLFEPNLKNIHEPVFVSGTDGVGTKLKIAFMLDKHDTVGIDCVAMCVNDIICSGAEPLFFLDYIALGKNTPEKVANIVKGISLGCVEAGCALIGGETAEMPGFYPDEEYDMAGFTVGLVDKKKIIDGKNIKSGNKLIGITSSGLHSNGYSLVRKVLNLGKEGNKKLNEYVESLGCTIGEELIKPTKIYVKTIRALIEQFTVCGISNITGGGFIENIPRMLPNGFKIKIIKGTWPVLPIFEILKNMGDLDEQTMYNTFNMGIGMVISVSDDISQEVLQYLNKDVKQAYIIGEIIEGEEGVEIC
jgi:phosphoribosylformylglycinamidine cyclo-ligase